MGKVLDGGIDEALGAWLETQPVFFVGTAPRTGGHVNVSPKGYDSLRVLGPHRVAYRDLTGSGAETTAHLADDGRITLMWCAFDQPPRIVRVQGTGRTVLDGDEGYDELDALVPTKPGARAIIDVTADRVATSCGFGVPVMELVEERSTLERWADKRSEEELHRYRARNNARSIDGLPALRTRVEVDA